VASARRPGYDHVADTLSKLNAQGTDDWLWPAGLVTYAALMLLFGAGLRRRFGFRVPGRILSGAVIVHAVLMVGVAVFRDDVRPGGFFTPEGALHDYLSGMAFAALVVAMLGAVALASVDQALRSLRTATLSVAIVMTVVGIAFLFTPPEVQGIPQRAFVTLAAFWVVFVAARSRRPTNETSALVDGV